MRAVLAHAAVVRIHLAILRPRLRQRDAIDLSLLRRRFADGF